MFNPSRISFKTEEKTAQEGKRREDDKSLIHRESPPHTQTKSKPNCLSLDWLIKNDTTGFLSSSLSLHQTWFVYFVCLFLLGKLPIESILVLYTHTVDIIR